MCVSRAPCWNSDVGLTFPSPPCPVSSVDILSRQRLHPALFPAPALGQEEGGIFVSISLEWQGCVMESPSCGTRSPRVQVDLMAPLFRTVLPALAFPSSRGHQLLALPSMTMIPVVLSPCPLSRDPPNLAPQGFFSSALRALCPRWCVWSCKVMIDAMFCIFLESSHPHLAMPCPLKGKEACCILPLGMM